MSILCHVVTNQALHEDTKVRGPGVEATEALGVAIQFSKQPLPKASVAKALLRNFYFYCDVNTCLKF